MVNLGGRNPSVCPNAPPGRSPAGVPTRRSGSGWDRLPRITTVVHGPYSSLAVTELVFDDPCLLVAVRREAAAFYREFRPAERFPGAPCSAWFCAPRDLPDLSVLVLETGVGADCARRALHWALSRPVLENVPYQPRVVLSAGFCGALSESLQVADVVLGTEVVDAAGGCWTATWPGELPSGEWRPPLRRGRLLTADSVIGVPATKLALGRQFDALAVDMESTALAEICARQRMPFGCVRAVSDTAHTALSPRLVSLLCGARVTPLRLTASLVAAPRLVAELWRLRRDTKRAGQQLAQALGELLTLTLPGAEG